jgi:hypothetical protein
LVTAALPHGVPTSLSLDTYSIWQNGFMESPLNISVQPCNPAGYFEIDPQITGIEKLVNQIDRIVSALKRRR